MKRPDEHIVICQRCGLAMVLEDSGVLPSHWPDGRKLCAADLGWKEKQ